MHKKYIVRLTNEERETLRIVVKKLKGSSQKVRRAQVLLKADADGPNWTDTRIAEAFDCRTKTVENIRQRLVRDGFEIALNGKKRESPPRAKALDGEQEAKVIAMRLGSPPKGFANWTLRLLAKQLVQLEIVDSISPETVRKTLKKRHHAEENPVLGDSSCSQQRVRCLYGGRAGHIQKALRQAVSRALHGRAAGATVEGNPGSRPGVEEACAPRGL